MFAFPSGRGLRPIYPIYPIRVWGGLPMPLWGGQPRFKTAAVLWPGRFQKIATLTPTPHRLAYGVGRGDKDKSQLSRERKTVNLRLEELETPGRIVIKQDVIDPYTGKQP